LATPLAAPTISSPGQNTAINLQGGAIPFEVNSDEGANSQITIQYVLEFSTTPNFAKGTYVQAGSFTSNQTGVLTSQFVTVNPSSYGIFANAFAGEAIYWRFGARNVADNPGPSPDFLTKERYVFGVPFSGTVTNPPPPPPGKIAKKKKVGTGKGG